MFCGTGTRNKNMSLRCQTVLVLALIGAGLLLNALSKYFGNKGNFVTLLKTQLLHTNQVSPVQSKNKKYKPPNLHYVYNNTKGQPFNLRQDDIEKYSLIPRKFVNLPMALSGKAWSRNVAFATGASENHFLESLVLIKSFQQHFPDHVLLYYDLGLETTTHIHKIKCLCNVEYRKFNYTNYPAHTQRLITMTFKVMIIKELLNEDKRDGVFWVDASIRFTTNNLQVIKTKLFKSQGIVFGNHAAHPAVINTHPALFKYINTDISQSKKMTNYGATGIFVYNTKFVYDNILRFVYFCALDVNCISPKGAQRTYGKPMCHRYDQSIFNVLLGNTYNFNTFDCGLQNSEMVYKIKRGTRGKLSDLCHKKENDCQVK